MPRRKMNNPLKEQIDYPDFVKRFVKDRLAELDMKATDELELYITQDVESHLLDAGKRVSELTPEEVKQINEFILERINEAGGF